MAANDYGRFYWCVKVSRELSENGEIYAFADEIVTHPDGSLVLLQKDNDASRITLLIAGGEWLAVYAASVSDGSAVSVEHWKGEVVE